MLRTAHDGDRDDVLRWRNHPAVRAVSLTRHVISTTEHAAWWDATTRDPTRRILVYDRANVPSGVVTFFDHDEAARTARWGFYLDNAGLEMRGELLPAWLQIQRQAVRYASDELGVRVLAGEVLADNAAVRQLNQRLGFVEVNTERREIDGVATDVVHVRKEW